MITLFAPKIYQGIYGPAHWPNAYYTGYYSQSGSRSVIPRIQPYGTSVGHVKAPTNRYFITDTTKPRWRQAEIPGSLRILTVIRTLASANPHKAAIDLWRFPVICAESRHPYEGCNIDDSNGDMQFLNVKKDSRLILIAAR